MSLVLQAGTVIDGRYSIVSLLGQGGVGTVYKAEQEGFDRAVAIKLLQEDAVKDKEAWERFKREGKILSELRHKNIPQLYQFGIYQESIPFIVMEFLPGKTLRKFLSELEQIPWTRALQIVTQICDAMEHAHKAGIIHRDLKPDNIMILPEAGGELIKVCDFGLARFAGTEKEQRTDTLTATGILIGTANYMSPEQCSGKRADQLSDIYSLSCILYEMLTGVPPFTADSAVGVIYKHINEKATAIKKKDLPAGLEQLIEKGMAKNPAERYQTMKELQDDLKLILSGTVPEAVSSAQKQKPKLGLTISLLAAIIGLVCIVCFGTWKQQHSQSRRNESALLNIKKSKLKTLVRSVDELLKEKKSLESQKKFEEAREISTELVQRYRRSAEPYSQARMWLSIAVLERHMDNLDKASPAAIDKARDVCKTIGTGDEDTAVVEIKAGIHLQTALNHFEKWRRKAKDKDLNEAESNAAAALALCQKAKNNERIIEPVRILLATCYFWQAKKTLLRSLPEDNHSPTAIPIFFFLPGDYSLIDNLPEMLTKPDKLKKPFSVTLPQYYTLLAHSYLQDGKLSIASDYINKSADAYHSIKETDQIARVAAVQIPKGSRRAKTELAYKIEEQCKKSQNEDPLVYLLYAAMTANHLNSVGDWRYAVELFTDQLSRFQQASQIRNHNYMADLTIEELLAFVTYYDEVLLKPANQSHRFQSSEALLAKLLDEAAVGRSSPIDFASIYCCTAACVENSGHASLAIRLCKTFLDRVHARGSERQHERTAWFIMATAYAREKKFGDAENCIKNALALGKEVSPQLETSAQKDLFKLNDRCFNCFLPFLLLKQEKRQEAEEALSRVISQSEADGIVEVQLKALNNVIGEFLYYYRMHHDLAAEKSLLEQKRKLESSVLNSKFHDKHELIDYAYQQVLGRSPSSAEMQAKADSIQLLNNSAIRKLFLELMLDPEFTSQLQSLRNQNECEGLYRKVFDNESTEDSMLIWTALENKSPSQLRMALLTLVNTKSFQEKLGLYKQEALAHSYSVYDSEYNGIAFTRMGMYNKAAKELEQSINTGANDAIAYTYLGTCKQVLSDFQSAMENYNKAISIDPNFSQVYLERASLYLSQSDFASCFKDLKRAEELNAQSPLIDTLVHKPPPTNTAVVGILTNIAQVCVRKKDLEEAQLYFSKAIALKDRKHLEDSLLSMRAIVYKNLRMYEPAMKDMLAAKKLDILDKEYMLECAAHLNERAEYIKEIDLLIGGTKQFPRHFEFWLRLSDLYGYWNEPQKRKDILHQAIKELNPVTANDYDKRGWLTMILYTLGENDNKTKSAAINDYSKAVELEPSNPHWLLARAQCLNTVGETELAERNYEKGAKMDPADDWCCLILGEHYKAKKEYLSAIREFKKGQAFHNETNFREHLAECYYKMGDRKGYKNLFIKKN